MENKRVTTTLTPELYDAWTRWTASRGIKISTGIREFIQHLTKTHPATEDQSPLEKRLVGVHVRLASKTVERIKIRMHLDGIPTIGAWVRSAIVAAAGQDVLTQIERADINNCRMEVRRVGVNLNQIARRLNTDIGEGDQQRDDIESAIREAKNAVDELSGVVDKFHNHTKIRWREKRVRV